MQKTTYNQIHPPISSPAPLDRPVSVVEPQPFSKPWERRAAARLTDMLLLLSRGGYTCPTQFHQHLWHLAAQIEGVKHEQ